MPINRSLWKLGFRKEKWPNWQCPACEVGLLEPRKDSFRFVETKTSRDGQRSEDWEPEWMAFTYSVVLDCNNRACNECVMSCGQGNGAEDVEYDTRGEPQPVPYEEFTPEYFFPHLNIFPIPQECPKLVGEEIRASFKLFFCDPPSAANHVRIAVENIMNEQG